MKESALYRKRKRRKASSSERERERERESKRATQGSSYLVDQEARSLGQEHPFQAQLVYLHPSPARAETRVQKYKR